MSLFILCFVMLQNSLTRAVDEKEEKTHRPEKSSLRENEIAKLEKKENDNNS